MLTSPHNPTVKRLVRMRDNRARRKAGCILVDGWRETGKAVAAGLTPLGVYVCEPPEGSEPESSRDRADTLRLIRAVAPELVTPVSERVMQKVSYGQSARGVVAEFRAPQSGLEQLPRPPQGLVLILDRFEKPGNIGAAFRCADAAGADAVILTPETGDRFNPNAIRSSLGTVFTVPSAAATESQTRAWLAEGGFRVFAARVESSQPMWSLDYSGPTALVIGSEADGLGEHWISSGDLEVGGVHIPMAGQADSLNASVSAALLLYEAARQRGASPAE